LVGRFVNLKKAGEHWKGLCPFHTEKTPSFTVNPKRGIFHCFGCGVGGDAFSFLMRQDRLAFPEAVRILAERSGVELPKERSPERPMYVKGQMLYALDVAREGMKQKNRAVVVEGYLDCLMAHQHGFTETVAALGTAFTVAQLSLLRRYAEEVVSVFDADAAGIKATSRLEDMLSDVMDIRNLGWSVSRTGSFEKAEYFPIKVAVLPEGHDPDSLLRAEGAPGFKARLEAARSILDFVLERTLGEEDLGTARGRSAAHARVALLLSKVPNAEEATALA